MEIKCGCGSTCIKSAPELLNEIELFYSPCGECIAPKLKKFSPLSRQINLNELNNDYGNCNCNKRHLDVVIAHILKIMIEEGIKKENSSLRNACTPLITPAFPLTSSPYLPENSVVILSDDLTKECAEKINNEVKEVKGVLRGNFRETVGLKDIDFNSNEYELLAGCDIRCDIVQTQYGSICIYKNQSKIHIEVPRGDSPKIEILKEVLDRYDAPSIIDCTCGPGTLGIVCLKAGASYVVFNDIWLPAVEMTSINLEANGFPVEYFDPEKEIVARGNNFKVYSEDIRKLNEILDKKFDICIIDTFPDVDNSDFINAASKLGKELIII